MADLFITVAREQAEKLGHQMNRRPSVYQYGTVVRFVLECGACHALSIVERNATGSSLLSGSARRMECMGREK